MRKIGFQFIRIRSTFGACGDNVDTQQNDEKYGDSLE